MLLAMKLEAAHDPVIAGENPSVSALMRTSLKRQHRVVESNMVVFEFWFWK